MKLQGDHVILTVTFDRNSIMFNEQEVGLFFCRDIYNGNQILAEVAILWKKQMRAVGLEWRDLNALRDVEFDIRMSKFAFPADQRATAKLFKRCTLADGDFDQSQHVVMIEHAVFNWSGEAHNVAGRTDFDDDDSDSSFEESPEES